MKIKQKKQLSDLYSSGNKADIQKVELIYTELEENLKTSSGNPEQLIYQLSGFWSRLINRKDRLIYKIDDLKVIVTVLSAQGHYRNK